MLGRSRVIGIVGFGTIQMDGPDAVEGDHGEVIQSVHRPNVSVCSSGEYGDWLFIQLDDLFNIAGIKTNTYQLDF